MDLGARFGYNGSLVDTEGFPDSDVEIVLSVIQARNRIACMLISERGN